MMCRPWKATLGMALAYNGNIKIKYGEWMLRRHSYIMRICWSIWVALSVWQCTIVRELAIWFSVETEYWYILVLDVQFGFHYGYGEHQLGSVLLIILILQTDCEVNCRSTLLDIMCVAGDYMQWCVWYAQCWWFGQIFVRILQHCLCRYPSGS